eukprot:TRINITY_DN5225_c0_g1_i8.p1 TRINITY_DN5225_c0_g1~~TRINITY_DN5225_c0_g1_i8.p1  ORF type:complete len:1237 (+),score=430.03 TRINITY_DN5225_c0_g1_i8:245-3712(+)
MAAMNGGGGRGGLSGGGGLAAAAAASATAIEGGTVQVSPLDDRRYRIVTLPSNGLRVMVVHDPKADKAAAALDVAVGHTSDPDDLPGLAHFLEHMLFLGTEKYPDEGSYHAFLSENGGYGNAFTAVENTNYQFNIMVGSGRGKGDGDGGGGEPATATAGDAAAGASAAPADADAAAAAGDGVGNGTGHGAPDAGADNGSGGGGSNCMGLQRFHEALDRFAQFFIHPLFTESATARELKSVDSEYTNNLQSDPHRMYQMHKLAASAAHPYSKFGTGSVATLRDTPAEKGIDVRAALLRFHAAYYSANLMCLTLVAPAPLDTLVEWATELFSDIPNHDAPPPDKAYADVVAFGPEQTGRIYRVLPIKDVRALELLWAVPPFHTVYRTKPASYVSHLLGHEGPGSLLSELKSRGWADGVSAGVGKPTLHWEAFEVSVDLTEAGAAVANDVIEAVYGYLTLVRERGVEKWIHDEASAVSDMAWRFKEREDPISLAVAASGAMHMLPDEHVLSASRLFFDYDESAIRDFLALLTPAAAVVLYVDKAVEGTTDAVDKWYGTPYRAEAIEADVLARWAAAKPLPSLVIPAPNVFIPTDFALVADALPVAQEEAAVAAAQAKDAAMRGVVVKGGATQPPTVPSNAGSNGAAVAATEDAGTCAATTTAQCDVPAAGEVGAEDDAAPAMPRPQVIRDDASVRLHYKLDRTFLRPTVDVHINLISPVAYASPRAAVLANLASMLLEDALNEYAYVADIAGLHYRLFHTATGMSLSVNGYSHKASVLLSAITAQLASFTASPARFALISELLRREYKNFCKDPPYQHAMYLAQLLSDSPRWHVSDYMTFFEGDPARRLTAADVNAFVATFREALHVEMLVHGNVDAAAALGMARELETTLGYAPLCALQRPHRRVVVLPHHRPVLARIPGPNAEDVNSAVQVLFQLGVVGDARKDVAVSLLAMMLNKPVYHALRTEQQLGYLVFSGMQRNDGVQAIRVIVQSKVVGPAELVRRIDAFLDSFGRETLPEMGAPQFREYVDAMAAALQETDKRLSHRTYRFWGEISAGTYEYGRHASEVAALRGLTHADLVAMWNRFMAVGAPERRVLVSAVHAPEHVIEEVPAAAGSAKDDKSPLVLDNVSTGSTVVLGFRNSRPLYPVIGYHNGSAQ